MDQITHRLITGYLFTIVNNVISALLKGHHSITLFSTVIKYIA